MKIRLVIIMLLLCSGLVYGYEEIRIKGEAWIKEGDRLMKKSALKGSSPNEKLALLSLANSCYLKALLERTEDQAKEKWIIMKGKPKFIEVKK